ncbi:MAG TPA: HipA domain-containing protein [Waddliaceae bacterium]
MNRCPITYLECGNERYSEQGLKLLDSRLHYLADFPYTAEQQRKLAVDYSDKLSIQGIQPKLSARLSATKHQFEVVERKGTFIIKPPHLFYQYLPENEDLTMHLAQAVGIDVPLHGLMYNVDGTLSYFIKRFDRIGRGEKIAVEDFAQLLGFGRDTKYDGSMEQLVDVIERYCTFPVLEKIKLFRLTLFAFLVGNEDMHLKNFSLIVYENCVSLSPAYDLINSYMVTSSQEELALPLAGKKRKFKKEHFFDYYGRDHLGLNEPALSDVSKTFTAIQPTWFALIDYSFLPDENKSFYKDLVQKRFKRLFPEEIAKLHLGPNLPFWRRI